MNLVHLKPIEKEDVFHQNFIDSYFNVDCYRLQGTRLHGDKKEIPRSRNWYTTQAGGYFLKN